MYNDQVHIYVYLRKIEAGLPQYNLQFVLRPMGN